MRSRDSFCVVDMQRVEQAMCHGGHHDARNADEKNARKQRITARKDFAGARMHHIDRAHATQIMAALRKASIQGISSNQ